MVDLGRYGAGNCMCGHAIRYQYQFINSLNHKTLPVGSECVKQLSLPKYNEVLDKLERLTNMAETEIKPTLDPMECFKKFKKNFSLDNIKALMDYGKIQPDTDYYFYRDIYNKRKLNEFQAERAKNYILRLYNIASKFLNTIENRSVPVTQSQVSKMGQDFEREAAKFANAKQKSLF